jgi:hypothetical protein
VDTKYLGEEEQHKLVRALAYRAGIVKMSGEVFSTISNGILHDMAVLLLHTIEHCVEVKSVIRVHRTDNEWVFSDLIVITPYHIEDAAKHLGMRPILFDLGCNEDEWDKEGNRLDAMEDSEDEYVQNGSGTESSDTDFEYNESDPESDESDLDLAS